MNKKANSLTTRLFLFISVLALLIVTGFTVLAQTEDEDVWSGPLNISNSGSSTSPVLAQDSNGMYHLFWRDQFVGIEYAFGDGTTWSSPVAPRFPFSSPSFRLLSDGDLLGFFTPSIYIDSQDRVHALWVGLEGELYYSRAAVANIAAGTEGWQAQRLFGSKALAYQIVEGANGRLHMVYLATAGDGTILPGLVYRFSDDGGDTWATPINIYTSDYYRATTAETANVHLTVGSDQTVFVAWDNLDLDSVFVMRSIDNGTTWDAPQIVDQRLPDDPAEATGPSQINLFATDSAVSLTWRASHDETECAEYVQQSDDSGASWKAAQAVHVSQTSCPSDGRFIQGNDGLLFLISKLSGNVYMQAQDGTSWSQPALQAPLASFENPITFRPVSLDCYQTAVTAENNLIVVGCGTGSGNDIWQVSRPLGGLENWSARFAPTPVWSQPLPIATSSAQMLQPELVVSSDTLIHAFWSQSENPVATGRISNPLTVPGNEIFYSRLEAGAWSAPRPVLASPNGSQADFPAVASNRQGSLFVVWAGDEPNGIYFSRALADRAASVTEWIEPQILPAPRESATWPSIVSDGGSRIYVAYTIPLNEERGIYLTRSDDDGDTWSDAVLVFDGEAANWDLIGPPSLTRTLDGTMHLLWTRWTQVPEMQAIALAYSRSEDDGQTWSAPEIVTEEPLLGSSILGVQERLVHRIWTGLLDSRPVILHQFSEDGGLTWSAAGRVVDPSFVPGPTVLIADQNENPVILHLAENNASQLVLQEWVWRTDRWVEGEQQMLQETAVNADAISAIAAPDGQIAVMYGSLILQEDDSLIDEMIYTGRQWPVDDLSVTRAPLPTLTPTPVVQPTNTPIPEPSPTPTATLAPVQPVDTLSGGSGGIIVGVAVAVVLVLVIFALGWRTIRAR
ncbi:MAG: exo-alpha-sialidase [Anaerolineales bacterium]|nr:exo-alpha-sialidase [Anaerolineales bacterium]